jgi:hypothetical protein
VIIVDDIGSSGGKHPERMGFFSAKHRDLAKVLCDRVNALMSELGIDLERERINEGFRLAWAKYGAKNSWHKRGGAVDLRDDVGFPFAHQITRTLLLKHGLRREDTDYTSKVHKDGGAVFWCHIDIGEPHGVIFKP